MPKQTAKTQHRIAARIITTGAFLVLAAGLVATHWQTVSKGLEVARGASIPWLVNSLGLMILTFLIAAAIYGVLALHSLRYWQTVLVEVSAAFVNRLLPSGLGGLGLHGIYLYKRKHTAAEATVVVSVNNLIGMAAHLLLLSGVIAFEPSVIRELFAKHHLAVPWIAIVVLLGAIVVLALIPPVRTRLSGFARNLLKSLQKLRLIPVLKALCIAMTLTLTYTLILLSCARSIGIELGLLQIFIVFSIGMLTSTATPTPGGLVGAEAGLFAGFVAYGVSAAPAAAAVLLFRLTTYWLPLLPGALALAIARRRRLV